MRLDNQRESSNVDDVRGQGGGFGFPGGGSSGLGGGGGGGMLIPLLLNTIGFRGVIILAIIYFALKMFTGIDLINLVNGGGGGISMPDTTTVQTSPGSSTIAAGGTSSGTAAGGDPGKVFVSKVLASTEDVWTKIFSDMGRQYQAPRLTIFSNFTQSACGTAQSAMGPFYCPNDKRVYIDLAFYQDMKDKLGAPGDFAQAYVVAHEVGHHVQTLLGITQQVDAQRRQISDKEANILSVKTNCRPIAMPASGRRRRMP